MQFKITHEWITGVSPHTSKPKTETCRLKNENDYLHEGTVYRYYESGDSRIIYQVGRSYAVQPGRGQRSIARIILISIEDIPDVRLIKPANARAEGFTTPMHFLETWAMLHDHAFYFSPYGDHWTFRDETGGQSFGYTTEQMRYILNTRPKNLYSAWRLTFGSQLSFDQLGGVQDD